MRVQACLFVITTSILTVVPARAASASEPQRLTAEILTDFPLGVGGALQAEWSYRLRTSVSLQWLPEAYVTVAEDVAQEIGGYNDITSALVRAAAQNALVFRVHAGWRPLTDLGLYFDVGYTLLALGGDVTTEDIAGAARGPQTSVPGSSWDITTFNHFLDVQVGWRIDLYERLSLRVAIGFAFTVASDATIDVVESPFPEAAARLADAVAPDLEDIFTSYVHTPTLTLALGYDIIR